MSEAGSGGPQQAGESPTPRDAEEIRRHEAHLVGQIYHLIEANHRLEEQLHRLAKVTEIADIFREQKVTRDTFELKSPKLMVPAQTDSAWARVDKLLTDIEQQIASAVTTSEGQPAEPEGGTSPDASPDPSPEASVDASEKASAPDEAPAAPRVDFEALRKSLVVGREDLRELRDNLGVVRESHWQVDSDWLSDVRTSLVAAGQAVAFLNEQSRELDMLRREKDSIMDGANRLEQNLEDLWKALNEKTTHIQRLEAQLSQIWSSAPYRAYKGLTRPFRRGGPS